MVTPAHFPPDVRIEKEAQALSHAGHSIQVFTPVTTHPNYAKAYLEIQEYGFQSSPGANFARLRNLFKQSCLEIVHLQDTPGSMQALLAAKSLGLKVIYDMHEIWPSLVIDNSRALTLKTALWAANLRAEQAVAFMGSNISLTVVDEATEYLQLKYRQRARVFSVRNFESLDRFQTVHPSQEFADEQGFTITYVGGIDGPVRGLQEVILAAALLAKMNVQFLIVGSGEYQGWLQLLTRELHLEKKVRFLGSKPFRDAMEIVAASDLCLVPHMNCTSTRHTLPHKISQYMALKKPVIATNLPPISRLFESSFIQWEPRTPRKLAELIISIREDKARRQELGESGFRLVSERYRWEDEGKKLVSIYESLSPN